MTSTNRIALDSEVWAQIEASAVDKGNGLFHPKSSDMKFLTEKILSKEGKTHGNFDIKYLSRRLYKEPHKVTTPYLTINAKCKDCTGAECKYKIFRRDKPDENEPTVVFEVIRTGDHCHQEGVKAIRGAEKRKKVAEEMVLISNGSAQDYVLKKIARGEPHSTEEVFLTVIIYSFIT